MLQGLSKFLPFYKFSFFADGDAGGGTGDGETGGKSDSSQDASALKAELERYKADNQSLERKLEDLRLEIMSPEYLDYLGGKDKSSNKEEKSAAPEVDFSKLTPEQVYQKAKEDAKKEVQDEIAKLKNEFTSKSQAETQAEVARFARTHDDYEKYRPVMYGLSLDPKHKELSLEELYAAAKDHVKRMSNDVIEEERKRAEKTRGEKPGFSTFSFDKDKKYTPDTAADEAWNEVVGKDGMPSL